MTHYCEYLCDCYNPNDCFHDEDCQPCEELATVKISGRFFCERHADYMEGKRDYVLLDGSESDDEIATALMKQLLKAEDL